MRAGNNDEVVVDCCDLDTLTEPCCCVGSVSEDSGRKGSLFGGRASVIPRQTGAFLGGWPNQLQTQVGVLPLMDDRSHAEGEVRWEGGAADLCVPRLKGMKDPDVLTGG
jgi:hypothetical protein